MSYTYDYPRPSVAADCVVFNYDPEDRDDPLTVLLVQRKNPPHEGAWALPGGFVNVRDDGDQGETFEAAAARELLEETGIVASKLYPVGTYGDPMRDPRGRVISITYFTFLIGAPPKAKAGDDAANALWYPVQADAEALVSVPLAFDHPKILSDALFLLKGYVGTRGPIGDGVATYPWTTRELLYDLLDKVVEEIQRRART